MLHWRFKVQGVEIGEKDKKEGIVVYEEER
jgi:hypothetical protein